MKKKMQVLMVGTVAALLIVGGGSAIGWNHAWAAAPVATSTPNPDAASDQPAPKPPREDGQRKPPGQGKPKKDERKDDRPCPDSSAPDAAPAPGAEGRGGRPAPAPGGSGGPRGPQAPAAEPQGDQTVAVSGGYETDPVDHGRPVVLIAAALGVPTEVFREAFSGVKPAGLDRGPTAEEAQKNKAALMSVLSPYGITNERLDEVSNYYRYNGSKGQLWQHQSATAKAIVTDGVLTGVEITNPGSGYTSAPTIKVKAPNGTIVNAVATVAYTNDFRTNGSLTSITLQP